MTAADEVLAAVVALGGALRVVPPDRLQVTAPAPLPPDLMQRLRDAKLELLVLLDPKRATVGDGLALLRAAEAAGLTIAASGGDLVIRGPKRAADVARRLLARKEAVIAALAEIGRVAASALKAEPRGDAWRVERRPFR